ncbi:MAG: polysaccharide biosynthesis/export family protein, partial [Flavobacteriaceae bacterium]
MQTPHTTLRFVALMKSHFFYILLFVCFASYAQSPQEQRILQEAKNRNITTQSQALDALQKSGISETQARIIAQQNGISFDRFLNDYFEASNNVVVTSTTSPDPSISDVVSEANSLALEENKAFSAPTPPMADPRFFGYAIFDQNPFLEKEYLLGNIDEGYLIAPGDALRIIVFGNNALEFEAVVDRNGNINIPEYGVFFAAGSTFKSIKSRLKVYLGKYFSGLLTAPPKTFLDVSLTQLTPTKVVVTGQVNAPGPHILNTQANPIAALYAAGGVKTSGTLREIRVYRNNRLLKTVDLYGYITSGKLDQDIKLTNNDIVFVGPRLSSVELKGSVKTSALYELKPEETLSDLIEFSGGLPVNTATDRVNVKRTDPATDPTNRYDKKIVTIDYANLRSTKQSFGLQDGDEVEFFPLLNEVLNTVTIQGNVFNPGTYSLEKFKDLKQLVENAARGVKEDTYFGKVDIKGLLLPSGEETFATYNLSEVLSGAVEVKLNQRDLVTVYSEAKVIGAKEVYISGYGVENTDPIAWRENMSVYDLIFENTSVENISFREDLFDDRVDLKTYDYDSRKYVTNPLSFNDEDGLKTTFLQPYDKVRLFNKNVLERSTQNVAVYGFVNNAGSFSLEKDMFVEDLILLAG